MNLTTAELEQLNIAAVFGRSALDALLLKMYGPDKKVVTHWSFGKIDRVLVLNRQVS